MFKSQKRFRALSVLKWCLVFVSLLHMPDSLIVKGKIVAVFAFHLCRCQSAVDVIVPRDRCPAPPPHISPPTRDRVMSWRVAAWVAGWPCGASETSPDRVHQMERSCLHQCRSPTSGWLPFLLWRQAVSKSSGGSLSYKALVDSHSCQSLSEGLASRARWQFLDYWHTQMN